MDGCFVRFWYSVSVRIQNGVFIISGMEAGCLTGGVWGVCGVGALGTVSLNGNGLG